MKLLNETCKVFNEKSYWILESLRPLFALSYSPIPHSIFLTLRIVLFFRLENDSCSWSLLLLLLLDCRSRVLALLPTQHAKSVLTFCLTSLVYNCIGVCKSFASVRSCCGSWYNNIIQSIEQLKIFMWCWRRVAW